MKKLQKYLLLCLFCLLAAPQAIAQSSMSDQQIMDFVIRENEKGTARDKIVTKLLERGVSIEQIQSVRKKMEKEKNGEVLGAKNISSSEATSRLRQNNGQDKQDNPYYQNRKRKDPLSDRTLSQHRRQQLQSERNDMYREELDPLLPDSLEMYDMALGYEDEEPEKQIYGHNIFNNKNLTFESNLNIPTPDDYKLGAGDVVYVDVWGASQQNYVSTVSPEGDINIEGFGPVHVNGLTVAQANKRLRSTLGARFGGSQVRLSVGQTKTISVHVMGEVQMPGTYTLSAFAQVFHALYMAGGPTEIGTLRNIKVYRNERLISTVDVYEYLQNGNLKGNVRLASGDVIIVGTYDCLVNVTGKVKRPMYYEMKGTESVGTLLKFAGGFTGDAYDKNVRLVRRAGGEFSIYTLDEFECGTFRLCDGDSVAVDSTLQRYRNMVEVKGGVFRPGMYQMDGSVSTVRQLIEKAGGVTEDAFRNRAIIHRRKENRRLEVISLDLAGLIEGRVADVALRNEDVLYVPSLKDKNEQQTLRIDGEVLYPGIYQYAEGTTIEDLILQAGGPTEPASLAKVDVARVVRDPNALTAGNRIAENFSFSVKEGFVVDGEPGFVLRPFDEVVVRRSPGSPEQEHVTVTGEVPFEGTYILPKRTSRLSDLLKECGGVTQNAYLKGARLERKLTALELEKQKELLKFIASGDSVDVRKLEIGEYQNVGIHLDLALKYPGDDRYDVVLRDNDHLIIPQFTNTVTISGEVLYPNTVAYKDKAKLKYYINQAGGYSMQAKANRVFAIHMNGTVTSVKSAKDIEPGCQIVVPSKAKRRQLSVAEIMSISMSLVTLGSVIATAIK